MRLGLYSKGLVGAAFAAGFPQLAAELATDAVSIWVMTSCVSIFIRLAVSFFFDMSDFFICAHLANGSRRKSEKCFPLQPKLNQDSERREDTILIEIRYEGPGIAKKKNAKRLSSGKMLNITGAA